jgi:hypothetical protein
MAALLLFYLKITPKRFPEHLLKTRFYSGKKTFLGAFGGGIYFRSIGLL